VTAFIKKSDRVRKASVILDALKAANVSVR